MSENVDEFVFMKEMAEMLKLDAEFHYDAEYRLCFMLIYKEDYEKLKDRMVSKKDGNVKVTPSTICLSCGQFVAISEIVDDVEIEVHSDDNGRIEESFIMAKCPHCGQQMDITDSLNFKRHGFKSPD